MVRGRNLGEDLNMEYLPNKIINSWDHLILRDERNPEIYIKKR
jgi:hypothetical protein